MLAILAWLPFLIDAIFNGNSRGHIQSLILGAVLMITAVVLFALGVIGDLLAGQRVMTQRVFERVRRIELALGVPPSHYERGDASRPPRRPRPRSTDGGRRARCAGGAAHPGGRKMSDASRNGHSTNGVAPSEPRGEEAVSSEQYGKTAGFLAVGVGITGIMTYGFFLVASHTLSKPDYGQITLLWSAVFITISALCCPVEQLLSRQVSERMAKGEPVNQTIRVAATIQFGLSLCFAVVALALRGLIQDDLLSGNETLYWVYFSAVLFYAVSYFARGFLAGSQRFGMFVGLILSESCFRTLFAVLVAVGLLTGQSAVAIGIVAAPVLGADHRPDDLLPPRRRRTRWRRPVPSRGRRGARALLDQTRRRFRRRGAPDHVLRTGLPQRRADHHPQPPGRRRGGLHLQRADAGAGAVAALPVDLDLDPPPPHPPP